MPQLNQYIYVLKPTRAEMLTTGPTEEEVAAVGRHFSYLQDLTQKGKVLMAGRTQINDMRTRGYVVFQAADDAAATELMENDPAVAGGVMTAQLFPFAVALWCDSFSLAD